ncbi:MAG: helix-turn-helix transcriptional regulator [Calditrichia bacterium]
METLKNNLKVFRFNCGRLTQQKLADQLSVSRQTIIAIENGRFNPSVRLALKMASFFNCKVEDLFYLSED